MCYYENFKKFGGLLFFFGQGIQVGDLWPSSCSDMDYPENR
jgi:hypothetical protein